MIPDNDVPCGRGHFPAESCTREDAMLLFAAYHKYGDAEVYRDVLSGTTAQVNRVKDEAMIRTNEFVKFDKNDHRGSADLRAAVEAWVAEKAGRAR